VDEVGPLVAVEVVGRHPPVHLVIEVDVRIHQAGRDDVMAPVHDAPAPVAAAQGVPFVHGDDTVAVHRDGAVADDAARRVHGHDGAAFDQQVDGLQLGHVLLRETSR
jgi:hypothetical protein